ncbi:hypothetical protein [Spirosoma aerolatum]|uniref:hypothetical protein n=1 Tax=Spirosoma aerolatum TaxID=1211326 RepID=UPI0012D32BED|nr:hypothetical protein [Spirosoma aerolatum]
MLACQPADNIPKDDSQYVPIEVGRYWVYEVRQETYSLSAAPVLRTYFLKETIGERLSSQSDKTYKLVRYKRNRPTDAWKPDSIWTVQQWPNRLIRTENSIAFIKLFFPIATSTTWNPNEYNSRSASIFLYEQVGKAYVAGAKSYLNTIQVASRQNDSTAISLNRYIDVYAYQIGLIFNESTVLAYCQSSPDCIGKGQIAYGYRRKQTLIETGVE